MGAKQIAYQYRPGTYKIHKVTVDIPEPEENEVQIKVFGVGLCHSDLHLVCSDTALGNK